MTAAARSRSQRKTGFAVIGFPPGTSDRFTNLYFERLREQEKPPAANPHPGMLDSFIRRRFAETKPQQIERLFELRSAADECARLAMRAGWENVKIEVLVARPSNIDTTGSLL
jgi:hypothetical protein